MANALTPVARGSLPQSSDLNQLINGWSATQDVGVLSLYAPISSPGTAPTAAVNTATGVLDSSYAYVVTFVTGGQASSGTLTVQGETTPSAPSAAVAPVNQQVNISAIPTGPTGTIARNLYRNKAGGSTTTGPWYFVAQIAGNSVTTYVDNLADSALGAEAPTGNTTGSRLTLPQLTVDALQMTGDLTITATGPSGGSTDNYASYPLLWDYVDGGTARTVSEYVDQFGAWTLEVSGSPVAQIGANGAIQTVGGQSTVGPVGVGAVVDAASILVTATTLTSILSVAAPVTGLYLVSGYAVIANGTSGNAITFRVAWIDPTTGVTQVTYFTLASGGTTAAFTGGNSVANGVWASSSLLVRCAASDSIVVGYQDPTNTPNDTVSAVVMRLT